MTVSAHGGEVVVNTTTAGDQSHPSVAKLTDGRFVVVWEDHSQSGADASGGAIRGQTFNHDGSASGGEFLVNTTTAGNQLTPVVTALAGGGFVAAWQDLSGSGADPAGIRAQVFDATGAKSGGEFLANTGTGGTQRHPAIATLADGRIVIAWDDNENFGSPGFPNIEAQIFDAAGAKSGAEIAVAEGRASNPPLFPALAPLSDGGFAVAFQELDNQNQYAVLTQLVGPNGALIGTVRSYHTYGVPGGNEPSLAAWEDGGFALASNVDTHNLALTLAQANSGLFTDTPINTPLSQDFQTEAVIARLTDGRLVVAWADKGTTGYGRSGNSLFAQVFQSTGDRSALNTILDPASASSPIDPAIAALGDDSFVVVWTDADAAGSGVHARIFDAPAPADYWSGSGTHTGTEFGDELYGLGGNDILEGLGGNDFLRGGQGDDVLVGGAGNDILVSEYGANNRIDGGDGEDVAVFFNVRQDFDIRTYATGGVLETRVWQRGVTEIGWAPLDGVAYLTHTEYLQFPDQTVLLGRAQLNHASSIDGDHLDDVIFQNGQTGEILFQKSSINLAGAPGPTTFTWQSATSPLGTDWKAVGSGDINPELVAGAEIIVQQQSTGTIWYASLDTGSTTWGVVDNAPGLDWKARAVADMNGDAAADAVLQNTTTGAIKYAAMFNGSFAGYDIVNQNITSDWLLVGAGDINRDGLADAVIQEQSTGTIYYAVMANSVFQSWGVISQNLTPDWHAKAVADVTGDGFADVIVQQASTGITYFTDMNSGPVNHWGVVTATVTADWVVQGTADVDNDGFTDVLFQTLAGGGGVNPGTTYYANMGPAGFEGWGNVASSVNSDWHVV